MTALRKISAAPKREAEVISLPIFGVSPFTLQDFPGRLAAIVWMSGCNMRCGYCHNPQIVRGGKGRYTLRGLMPFLEQRRGLLDGIVISGGEPTLYPGLPHLVETLRGMDYAIKLDTNGTRPAMVADLLARGWLDYVALDYKAPPDKFSAVTACHDADAFSATLDILCGQSAMPFEVRTTVHTDLLDEGDIATIMEDLTRRSYHGTYYVQNYCYGDDRLTLGHLPPQRRELNRTALPQPHGFSLAFRNF